VPGTRKSNRETLHNDCGGTTAAPKLRGIAVDFRIARLARRSAWRRREIRLGTANPPRLWLTAG